MKISIIVPVYNCEKFIGRCIDSVLKQTYKDYELILVNDGSTDNSLEIIQSYKNRYPSKIVVETQDNAGAPAARNKGISLVRGEFLTFIDSDDYIDDDFLSKLITNNESYDLIISGYKKTNSERVLFTKIPEDDYWSLFKYTTNWSNLYKTSFIREHNIHFNSFRIGEDVDFTLQCIVNLESYKILNYAGYSYFDNDESITNTMNKNEDTTTIENVLISMNNYALTSGYKKYDLLYFYFIKTSIFNLYMQRKKTSISKLKKLYLYEIEIIRSLKCLGNKKYRFHWQKNEEFYVNVIVNLFNLTEYLHILDFTLFLIKKV